MDPFGDEYPLVDRRVQNDIIAPANPLHLDTIDFFYSSQSKVKTSSKIALVAAAAMDFIDPCHCLGDNSHSGPDPVPVGRGSSEFHLNPGVLALGIVPEYGRCRP